MKFDSSVIVFKAFKKVEHNKSHKSNSYNFYELQFHHSVTESLLYCGFVIYNIIIQQSPGRQERSETLLFIYLFIR